MSEIHDLTLASVAPALDVYIKLDRSSAEQRSEDQMTLLDFLQLHHLSLIPEICCVDFTIYEYGLEGMPFFHLIGPRSSLEAYREVIRNLVTPEFTPFGERSCSIALNRTFMENNCCKIITLPLQSVAAHSAEGAGLELVEDHYPLEAPSSPVSHDLKYSLAKFRTILSRHQGNVRSQNGQMICALICCNFTIPEVEEAGPLRSLGQLFLGLSESPFSGTSTDSLRPEIASVIGDLGFLLYRGGSASLLLGAGRDSSRSTFAHEAKKLVQLIHDWPVPLGNFFDLTDCTDTLSVCLKKEYGQLQFGNFYVVVMPEYFRAAIDQILAWTMADSISDLPFYSSMDGDASLPMTFGELLEACYEAAVKQCVLVFLRAAGSMQAAILGVQQLEEYLQSKMPGIIPAGSAVECSLDWSPKSHFRPKLVSFSRLLMVIFREALQHGSWKQGIKVTLDLSAEGVLNLMSVNGLRNGESQGLFDDLPSSLPVTPRRLRYTRDNLHKKVQTFSPVGRQGGRQIALLVESAGGSLERNRKDADGNWRVQCRFDNATIAAGDHHDG